MGFGNTGRIVAKLAVDGESEDPAGSVVVVGPEEPGREKKTHIPRTTKTAAGIQFGEIRYLSLDGDLRGTMFSSPSSICSRWASLISLRSTGAR